MALLLPADIVECSSTPGHTLRRFIMSSSSSRPSATQLFRSLRDDKLPELEKLETAQKAWQDSSFRFPKQREFLLEWLLTRLLKTKDDTKSVWSIRRVKEYAHGVWADWSPQKAAGPSSNPCLAAFPQSHSQASWEKCRHCLYFVLSSLEDGIYPSIGAFAHQLLALGMSSCLWLRPERMQMRSWLLCLRFIKLSLVQQKCKDAKNGSGWWSLLRRISLRLLALLLSRSRNLSVFHSERAFWKLD